MTPKPKEIDAEVNSPVKSSSHRVVPNGTLLVPNEVFESLSDTCYWLHTCVMGMSEKSPLGIPVDKVQFGYMEDTFIWVPRQDVREFLCREKLNVSLIQSFMRLLY